MSVRSFAEELSLYIRTGAPLIYVSALEVERAVLTIQDLCKDIASAPECKIWRNTSGWDGDEKNIPNDVPGEIDGFEENTICVLVNFHWYLGSDGADPVNIQSFIDGYYSWKGDNPKTVIILSPEYKIATELDRLFISMTYTLPNREQLKSTLDSVITGQEGQVPTPDEETESKVLDSAAGLTEDEFENAVTLSILTNDERKVDPAVVMDQKAKTLTKSGMLDYWQNQDDLGSVGGMANLKEWLAKREKALGTKAREFGLPYPKGMMLLGIPGTGKSLVAKCVAKQWDLQLIRFDLGKVFGSLVGQSEERMRMVLAQVEALAPCVTGDTTITLGDGSLITAEKLYEGSGDKTVIAVQEDSLTSQEVSLITGLKRGKKPVFKVSTAGGNLKATDNHKLLTLDGWKEVNELSRDDFIFFPTIDVPETKKPLFSTLLPEGVQLKKGSFNTWRRGHGGFSDSILETPFEVTEDIGELLGMLDSDGTIGVRRVAFHSSNKGAIRQFVGLMKSLFNLSAHVRINHPKGYTSTKKDGTAIISTKDSYVAYVDNKLLAESLLTLRDNFLKFEYNHLLPAYLRAFVNGDGWCGVQDERYLRFAITQVKEKQKTRIVEALRRIGILGRFVNKNLYISGEGARRLYEKLMQAPSFKGDKLDQLVSPVLNYKHTLARTIRYTERGAFARVLNVRRSGSAEVYDFSCDRIHSYISDGMVSHNCVLWIDEAEKGLAGAGNTSSTDSGVTKRIFGSLISWMQERPKEKLIYMVMTVNDVNSLPPELLRKGRFDEIFWVDLPNDDERVDILTIHLNKRGRMTPALKKDLGKVGKAAVNFSGAELEVAIEDSMFNVFDEGRAQLTPEDLISSIRDTVPLATTRQAEIDFMRNWAKDRTKPAQAEVKTGSATTKKRRMKL